MMRPAKLYLASRCLHIPHLGESRILLKPVLTRIK